MKLSTKTRYGARILIELALNGRHDAVQVSKIAARQKIPVKYLEQILRELKQSGLVESIRGPKGGHKLVEDPGRISLGLVVRLFEGQTDLVDCISFPENCSMSGECLIRNAWNEATAVLYEKLDGISIADLINDSAGEKDAARQACPTASDTIPRKK